jgi:diaminohydroxyphosphoribosylaminopyrimidine deaminase / 5-amino-6-(5-phosphoribosylamino)uracil reductase
MQDSANDEKFMRRCLDLALQGKGNVAPNPLVGCVIVHDNTIIGEGFHQVFGQAHAEVNAIANVKNPELLKNQRSM